MKTTKPRGQRPAQAELPDPTSDDDLLDSLRAGNWFDCVGLDNRYGVPFVPSIRIFGNANLGMLNLTNLQIPGRLMHGHGTAILQGWYARTNIPYRSYPELEPGFRMLLEHTYLTMMVGDRRRWQSPLSDLYRAGHMDEAIRVASPRPCWPLPVPAYQNVSVTVDFFNSRNWDPRDYAQLLTSSGYTWSDFNPLVWIHLEGVELPEHDELDGTDEESLKRWRKLCGRVMRLLTRSDKHVEDTAEHIARWLGAQLPDDADDATKAQFGALADAIRERQFAGYRPTTPETVGFRGSFLEELDGDRARRRLQLSMDAGAYMDIITPIGNGDT